MKDVSLKGKTVVWLLQNHYLGGAERFAAILADSFLQRGAGQVFFFRERGPVADMFEEKGFKIFFELGELDRMVSENELTVYVHSFKRFNDALLFKKRGWRVIWHIHSSLAISHEEIDNPSGKKNILMSVLTIADRVLTASAAVKGEFARIGKEAVLMPTCIGSSTADVSRRERRINGECLFHGHGPVVGTVSRVISSKSLELFIGMAGIVKEAYPKTKFLIAGEISDKAYFRELCDIVKEKDLEANVLFAGYIDDIGSFYRDIDIFVLCSHDEGMPLSVLEAMSYAKPVICPLDWGRNIVRDGAEGILVPSGREDLFAAAVTELLADREKALRIGIAAESAARNRFSSDSVLKKYIEHIFGQKT